ncbi:MAG: DUF885 family protein, partial [Lysobacteraceae bacterium]
LATAQRSASTAEAWLPSVDDHSPDAQRIAPLLNRYQTDLYALQHVHDIEWGPERFATLDAFFQAWQQRLQGLDFETLGLEDRIDWTLWRDELRNQRRLLAFQQQRMQQVAGLLPNIDALLQMLEARRALHQADGKQSADILEATQRAIRSLQDALQASDAKLPYSPAQAQRAVRILQNTLVAMREWHAHQDGFDPEFSYWTRKPFDAYVAATEALIHDIQTRLAHSDDPEVIIGDPIGREALLAELSAARTPYSPEQILEIAERELAWCRVEMQDAAKAMGFARWQDALEAVKQHAPAPGKQPDLVVELADEAINYVSDHQLVTVPALARRDWRMNMLSPQAQLEAPFFLGGEDVWVSYPHDSMPQDKKRMAMRGNNRHFSRAVVHHELIPGHHLQHFYNSRYQAHRQLFATPFWTEGWALYWEMFLYQRGFAQSPEDRIGMLFWRSHRAARIQFSLAFHLGKMSPQQAVDFLVEEVGHERENAAAEVRRSFNGDWSPLYQAAYMLGGLQFIALRKELVDSGQLSDLQFHDQILRGGPMPVDLVRARLRGQLTDPDAQWRFDDR